VISFIQNAEGRIHIGKTRDLSRRLAELSTESAGPLRVLATIPSEDVCANPHRQAEDWARGEWFDPSPALTGFVESLPKSQYAGLTSDQIESEPAIDTPAVMSSPASIEERLAVALRILPDGPYKDRLDFVFRFADPVAFAREMQSLDLPVAVEAALLCLKFSVTLEDRHALIESAVNRSMQHLWDRLAREAHAHAA
jgi:hypothetical protein